MKQEYLRVKNILKSTDPSDAKYAELLGALESISRLIDWESPNSEEDKPVIEQSVVAEPIRNTTTVNNPNEIIYTKEAVRDILSEASKAGVKIQTIMAKYIPEGKSAKLSEVPFESYAALVEEIEHAR